MVFGCQLSVRLSNFPGMYQALVSPLDMPAMFDEHATVKHDDSYITYRFSRKNNNAFVLMCGPPFHCAVLCRVTDLSLVLVWRRAFHRSIGRGDLY